MSGRGLRPVDVIAKAKGKHSFEGYGSTEADPWPIPCGEAGMYCESCTYEADAAPEETELERARDEIYGSDDAEITEMRRLSDDGHSLADVAQRFGTTPAYVAVATGRKS